MKKSTVVWLCFFGLIVSLFALQNYNQRRLKQVMDECNSKIAIAQLDGKNPTEVAAFLDKQKIVHDSYYRSRVVTLAGKNTSYQEGFIDAYAGPDIYIFKWPWGTRWFVRIPFIFDDQSKYRSSFVYAEGRR